MYRDKIEIPQNIHIPTKNIFVYSPILALTMFKYTFEYVTGNTKIS